MRVLGLETSCDETGLAIYDGEQGLLGQVLYSQIDLHKAYGGVVPELASRDHIRKLIPLLEGLLADCQLDKQDIDAVAYTRGPGLMGALMTGALFGRSLAYALNVPAIGVHHMEGHLLAPLMPVAASRINPKTHQEAAQKRMAQKTLVQPPFLALLVSGGHTQLVEVRAIGDYEVIGESIDDAAGECFDKCAKMLHLPYPGGPNIAKLATNGDPLAYELPRPMLHKGLDFSFSGMKTAVNNLIKDNPNAKPADIAASFEYAMVDTLVKKCLKALKYTQLNRLVIAGGVSANVCLRQTLETALSRVGAKVHYAPAELCTDNGAMIAFAGWQRLNAGQSDDLCVTTTPRWSLGKLNPVTYS